MFKVAHSILLANLCLSLKYINETHSYNTKKASSNNFVLPTPRNNVLKEAFCIKVLSYGITFPHILK